MSQNISVKLGQLLDRTLFALSDASGNSRAQRALDEIVAHAGVLRAQTDQQVHEASFQLGAAHLLQTLLVRVMERREGNLSLAFVRRRKYVRDLLHILATSEAPVAPSDLATKLGAQPSAITALLKEAENLGLVSQTAATYDGRARPRVLTSVGRQMLTAVKPDWPLKAPRASAQETNVGSVSVVWNTRSDSHRQLLLSARRQGLRKTGHLTRPRGRIEPPKASLARMLEGPLQPFLRDGATAYVNNY